SRSSRCPVDQPRKFGQLPVSVGAVAEKSLKLVQGHCGGPLEKPMQRQTSR
ncbi:hypothetical protein NDU88_006635, partial [Pleurodeles waltl]